MVSAGCNPRASDTDVGEKIISEVVFDIHDDKQSANMQISCEDIFSVALNEAVPRLVCNLVFAPSQCRFLLQFTLEILLSLASGWPSHPQLRNNMM